LRSAKYRHLRDNEAPVGPADQQPVAPI
jgi:hypothetical protein